MSTSFIINTDKITSKRTSNNIYELETENKPDLFLAVSDRPVRKYQYIPYSQSIWDPNIKGNTFYNDPPNGVIDYRNSDKKRVDVPITILNSVLLPNGNIKFKVKIIPGILGDGIKKLMRNVVMYID